LEITESKTKDHDYIKIEAVASKLISNKKSHLEKNQALQSN
jgi:hypothetical protein